jgi:hypothetical protein
MGSLSIWHWVIVLLFISLLGFLIGRKRKKACPRCAEKIKAEALVCRFCGYEFPKSPSDAH